METKHMTGNKPKKQPALAKPSSSVLLISPTNQILLLHRVKTSSSFASAHVFPGGNVSEYHDGKVPAPDHPERHIDSDVYRLAAIRETFEESGILLVKSKETKKLLAVEQSERENGRKLIHSGTASFPKWVDEHGGIPDTDNLIPFSRWITPPQVPKRFTTQMYLYFLPTAIPTNYKESNPIDGEAVIPPPTHDGGLEHTAAQFLAPDAWIKKAQEGSIILYPPQFFLLSMIAQFLKPTWDAYTTIELERQRRGLLEFVKGGDPAWKDVCISPIMIGGALKDGRSMLNLEHPGDEVKAQGRRGNKEYVVIMGTKEGSPSKVEVQSKKDIAALLKKETHL